MIEAIYRGLNVRAHIDRFKRAPIISEHIPTDRTEEQFMAEYLLTKVHNKSGRRQITEEEEVRIKELV
jgi:hypothetical protein